MTSAYVNVNLATLAPPQVIAALDFETILAQMITDLQARDSTFNALVESDPAYKVLEVCAYRELLVRQRVNDAAQAIMLAYATGADLDQIAAGYDVQRLQLTPGDPTTIPPTLPTYESDDNLRRRVQLAFDGLSTAGPIGAYQFHALGADPNVLDVSVTSPSPGAVLVTVLSNQGNGAPSSTTLTNVTNELNSESVRPLTDTVTVQGATIVNYAITATLNVFQGPDPAIVQANALAAAQAYCANQQRLGRAITLPGIYGALMQPGVQTVTLTSPTADVAVTSAQAGYCTAITLSTVIVSG